MSGCEVQDVRCACGQFFTGQVASLACQDFGVLLLRISGLRFCRGSGVFPYFHLFLVLFGAARAGRCSTRTR